MLGQTWEQGYFHFKKCSLSFLYFVITRELSKENWVLYSYLLASLVWVVQNFIIKDWIIQCQSQSDRMCWLKISYHFVKMNTENAYRHFFLCHVKCSLIGFLWFSHNLLSSVSDGNFCQISEVVSLTKKLTSITQILPNLSFSNKILLIPQMKPLVLSAYLISQGRPGRYLGAPFQLFLGIHWR